MAFLPDGNIVVTDEGFTGFVPDVVEVNPATGARTLIPGRGRGSGPALAVPDTVAVEASGDILVSNEGVTGGTQLLRINPATGDRVVLSANGTGTGPTITGASVGLENEELRPAPAADPGPADRCGRRRRERSAVEPVTVVVPARCIARAGCRAGGRRCCPR